MPIDVVYNGQTRSLADTFVSLQDKIYKVICQDGESGLLRADEVFDHVQSLKLLKSGLSQTIILEDCGI